MPYTKNNHRRSRSTKMYKQPKKRYRGQYINPERFIKEAQPVSADQYQAIHKFDDFNMIDLLKNNLRAKGYEIPSPIQDQTIPLALEGNDIIGIANTGTGKTASFAVPVLNKLIIDRESRVLIVAPTRELAEQIELEMESIANGSGLRGALLIGGSSIGRQLRDLRLNPSVVIGTPGRIKDHLERSSLKLGRFNMVVLDEVDRMLDMGFLPDITTIMNQLPKDRQSLFFSATIDKRVEGLIENFSNNPIMVKHKTSDTSDNVHQDVVRIGNSSDKIDRLHDILIKDEAEKIIVFDETQRNVEKLGNELVTRGFKADVIHGGKNQRQRQRALLRFKDNEVNILVATDVAARGIDVKDITHVINYSVPQTYDDYTHRIGRAGRAGRVGYALTFINE